MFGEFFNEQWPLFLATFVIILMLIYSYVGDRLSGFQSVGADQAVRVFNDGAYVLDVRTAGEYKGGYIGEAINISVSDLASRMGQLPADKEASILVYCQSGARSSRAAGMIAKNGYTNVYNLSGGISTWKNANLPVGVQKSKKNKSKKKK